MEIRRPRLIYIINFTILNKNSIKAEWFKYISPESQCIMIGFQKTSIDDQLFSYSYISPKKNQVGYVYPSHFFLVILMIHQVIPHQKIVNIE